MSILQVNIFDNMVENIESPQIFKEHLSFIYKQFVQTKIIFNYYFCCSVCCFEFVIKAIKFKMYLLDILLKWTKIIETIHVTYKNISCSLWIFSWMTANIKNILLCPIMGCYLPGYLAVKWIRISLFSYLCLHSFIDESSRPANI